MEVGDSVYFFVGGAAGAAAVIGAVARWLGDDRELARDCRWIAAAGGTFGAAVDHGPGRPSRFLEHAARLQAAKPHERWAHGRSRLLRQHSPRLPPLPRS